ncbi:MULTISPECIES: nuclease-related domain-containing protein [Allobacillus]|uniref:NERD domain-containing protein n=1 Tax=Allobacillus salarius TaxID=1955272 RepID=A0A556PGI0_9BACI|nr:nuclease-related domain-containing protein [Allobacillus salarius]TSJ63506.1 NERD domain-containing protein [Allobacillus salarius]
MLNSVFKPLVACQRQTISYNNIKITYKERYNLSIDRKSSIPPHVLKLQALYHRLPQNHSRYPFVEKRIRNELSGLYGESRLYYPLSKIPTPHNILQNTRLYLHSSYFQIDFLIITSKFLLILESKYYSDDLMFDDTVHQVIQKKDQQIKVFDDPVLQAEEQAYQLAVWLEKLGYSNLPIEYYVVMTNSQTRLRIDPTNNHHAEKVISLQRLPSLFRELIKKYQQDLLTLNEMSNLTKTISNHHQTYIPDILKTSKVSAEDILKGVICMNCGVVGMKMYKLRWQCVGCGHRSSNAHENTLKDYFLLMSPIITNQKFRDFALLRANSTARDMLNKASFKKKGDKKFRKYHLYYDFNSEDFSYLSNLTAIRSQTRR